MGLFLGNSESTVFSGSGLTQLSGSSVTLSCWVKVENFTDAGGGTQTWIFRHEGATNGYFRFGLDRTGNPTLQWRFEMATSAGSASVTTYTGAKQTLSLDGRWHHLVQTMGSDQIARFYIDGELIATINTFRTLGYTGAVTTRIGGSGILRWFKMSDVRYYQRVLTYSEIMALYQGKNVVAGSRWVYGNALTGVDLGTGAADLTASGTSDGFQACEDPPMLNPNYRRWVRRRRKGKLAGAAPAGGGPGVYLRRRRWTTGGTTGL